MVSDSLFRRYYPGSAHDGTAAFYGWLRSYCNAQMRVLNVGAGPPTNTPRRVLRGEVRKVVGVDIDPVVLSNPELDDAHVTDGVAIPFPADTFDLAYADYVLEHVERPRPFLEEIRRTLKPGGSFFFRTPNVWHYVGLISRLTPHSVHRRIANPARRMAADAHEPWPTFYRLNTRRAIAKHAAGFSTRELRMVESEPCYLMFNSAAFVVGVAYERAVNKVPGLSGFRANIFGRLAK